MITEKIKLFPDRETTLTTYIHEPSREMEHCRVKPAILVFPGGGYFMCSDREAEVVAMQYYSKGFNAFVLHYCVGKENAKYPRPLEDAEKAMETIIERAEEFCIFPDKIAVIGFSAGGHLAAELSTIGKIKPRATILGYPCVLEEMCKNVLAESQPSLDDKVDENTPPTFIFAACDDTCVPIIHSLKYAEALDKNKIPFEVHIYSEGGHGFATADYMTCGYTPERLKMSMTCDSWIELSLKWVDRVFNDIKD